MEHELVIHFGITTTLQSGEQATRDEIEDWLYRLIEDAVSVTLPEHHVSPESGSKFTITVDEVFEGSDRSDY